MSKNELRLGYCKPIEQKLGGIYKLPNHLNKEVPTHLFLNLIVRLTHFVSFIMFRIWIAFRPFREPFFRKYRAEKNRRFLVAVGRKCEFEERTDAYPLFNESTKKKRGGRDEGA